MFFCENYKYPEVTPDGKIDTLQFLDASKGIVKFVELLGRIFSPIKYDINGNIEKLEKIYTSDKDKFQYLNDIVEYERSLPDGTFKVGTDALLWLRRALEYVQLFLASLANDFHQGSQTDNLAPFFKRAYEEKLKPYHGWMVQKIFALCLRAAPSRKHLVNLLANGKDGVGEQEVIEDVEEFLRGMSSNLDVVVDMYKKFNLDSDAKV